MFLFKHLSGLLGRGRTQADLNDELNFHLEKAAEQNTARGMPVEEARRKALIDFGGVQQTREAVQEARWTHFAEVLAQDLRYAWRTLRKTPGFTTVALITLALGIGANTAIFTVVNSILLRPLRYPNSDRILRLAESRKTMPELSIAYLNFIDWQAQNHVFERMGAVQAQSFVLNGGDQPELLPGRYVSEGFFATLGVKPMSGRTFLPADDQPSAAPVAVISYGLWQRRFGAKREHEFVGSQITLDQKSYTVVGILPKDFDYRGVVNDIFVPIGLKGADRELTDRDGHPGIYAIARLKPGITIQQANAEMAAISGRLAQQYPNTNAGGGVNMDLLQDFIVGETRPRLLLLFAAVGLVLLIACVNIANLLLGRASTRAREIAIRAALGAGRRRIVRQVLTESLLLALMGGVMGALAATAGIDLLVKSAPEGLPRLQEVQVDGLVLGFTFVLSLVTGVVFGAAPAFHALNFHGSLNDGVKSSVSLARQKLRNVLVVSELALSLLLLIGAGLVIRSFGRLVNVAPGLNPKNLLTARINLPETRYRKPAEVEGFFDELLRQLNAAPGLEAAATNTPLPFSFDEWDVPFLLEGSPAPSQDDLTSAYLHFISPEYVPAMQIPLVKGRNIAYSDNDEAPAVVLVNQSFAARYLQGQDPIGKRARFGGYEDLIGKDFKKSPWLTIVGVIGDVKQYGLDKGRDPEVFTPYAQHPGGNVMTNRSLVLRTVGDPLPALAELQRAVHQVDKDQPIADVATMEQLIANSLGPRRTPMYLLIAFAALALALAATGIYGVLSYWVAQRSREIGIRMALGASRRSVVHLVVGQGARLMIFGMIIGLVLALALGRFLASQLFNLSARDPITFLTVSGVLGAVAALSCFLPAWRASRVDPLVALRYE
jgi:putative ABC transport system permease protein